MEHLKVYDVSNLLSVYENHFINNSSPLSQAYLLRGTAYFYKNGIGNYWSDHQSPDVNRDGIVDFEHFIMNIYVDKYPLIIGNVPPIMNRPTIPILYSGIPLL